jgi:hypothetical protein
LRLVLLILQEGQHLGVLLLQALHVHQVGLGVIAQGLFLLLDLFELSLRPLSFRACFHQQ